MGDDRTQGPRTKPPWRNERLRGLLTPRAVAPAIVGLSLILVLMRYADAARVLRVVGTFRPRYLVLIAGFTLGYEVLRAAQWLHVVRALDPGVRWRVGVLSYMGGELAKALPGGQYFQAYLLSALGALPLARSTAATTVILWLEAAACALVVGLLGIGSWHWVRPVAGLLLLGIGLIALALRHHRFAERPAVASQGQARLQRTWTWFRSFGEGASALLQRRVVALTGLYTAGYLACAALSLWAIVLALGVPGIGPREAIAVYAFALGVGLVIPIPWDLGLTEAGGFAALGAFGVPPATALAVMLAQRLLQMAVTGGIALASIALLRRALDWRPHPDGPDGTP